MPARLTEDRAMIIHNAIMGDPSFFMSDGWLMEHHVTKEECITYVEYGLRLAQMYDWRDSNLTVGS